MKTTNKILIIALSLLLGLTIMLMILVRITTIIEPPVEGSGTIVTIEKNLEPFNNIKVGGNINLILYQADSVHLTIKGHDNLIDLLEISRENEKIEFSLQRKIDRKSKLELHLSFRQMESVTLSSGAQVSSKSNLNLDSVSIHASSGANARLIIRGNHASINTSSGSQVEMIGITNSVDIKSSSGASVICREFEAQNVSVATSSGASNDVNVTNNLNVTASSGASVTYIGNPATKIERLSSGASLKSKN